MRLIISGSRDLTIPTVELNQIIEIAGFKPTEIVSGAARGIDLCGEKWAVDNQVHVARFPADWDKYGPAAGPIRNKEMAEYGDALLAFPGVGKGTWGMINLMREADKPYKVFSLSKGMFLEEWELE